MACRYGSRTAETLQVHLAPLESPGHSPFQEAHHDWQDRPPSPEPPPAACRAARSCRSPSPPTYTPESRHSSHSRAWSRRRPNSAEQARIRTPANSSSNPSQIPAARSDSEISDIRSNSPPRASRIYRREALKQKRRNVGWIQRINLALDKIRAQPRHQHRPKPGSSATSCFAISASSLRPNCV